MNEVQNIFDEDMILLSFNLECLDCGYENTGYIAFGFDPNLKIECPNCRSRNTERS